ncbi:MAG: CPBP family intramembrane glutamic endopeptidase [Ekhidna sp.]
MSILVKIRSIKTNFIDFLKSPKDYKYLNVANLEKLKDVLALVLLELAMIIPIGLLIYLLEVFKIISPPDHLLEDSFKDMSFIELFFYAVILAPFLEEIMFRGFIVLKRFYPLLFFIEVMASLGKRKFILLRRVKRLWGHIFPAMVVASSLFFGYVHVFNYQGQVDSLLVPLLIAPQVVSGFFLVYARVRYGLAWSMIAHAATNLILLILQFTIPLE